MFNNALVSVSDKTGLLEFLRPYVQRGMRVVSTGGTARFLKDNGISVVDVSQQTGFPEVMGGRVKTLHPHVHMALLARLQEPEDDQLLKDHGLQPFDLVVCNLYPFEATALKFKKSEADFEELIENIDIGGPTLLRASAKNFSRVTVVCDPADYSALQSQTEITIEDRLRLAAKVFAHTSTYDSLVASQLGAGWGPECAVGGKKIQDLRYGENPHQKAEWYRLPADDQGLHAAQILQGKPLSYNNILDLDAAASLVRELKEPAAVAVKHNNPCGAAIHSDLSRAVDRCLKADPVSVFGGIIACNESVDEKSAEMMAALFLECVVAPSYSPQAKEIFAKKKNLRVLQWPQLRFSEKKWEIRSVTGGFLVQDTDRYGSDVAQWKFLREQPRSETLLDLIFAEKVCSGLKSNAIALVKAGQTVGLGMGQVNRVEAVTHAIERMRSHHGDIQDVVMASDAFFPFPDSIEKAYQAGVKWVLQPGGSVKDQEVFAAAERWGVNLVITGTRHFRH